MQGGIDVRGWATIVPCLANGRRRRECTKLVVAVTQHGEDLLAPCAGQLDKFVLLPVIIDGPQRTHPSGVVLALQQRYRRTITPLFQ